MSLSMFAILQAVAKQKEIEQTGSNMVNRRVVYICDVCQVIYTPGFFLSLVLKISPGKNDSRSLRNEIGQDASSTTTTST